MANKIVVNRDSFNTLVNDNAALSGAAFTGDVTVTGNLTVTGPESVSINGNTISSTSGALNLTPAVGSAIVLDGTVNVDAGVITGATSISSTAFVGALTGDVSGNAATATKIASITNNNIVQLDVSQTLTNKSLTSPVFTGTPIAPTAASATNSTQLATTAFVHSKIDELVGGAPGALDTLNELAGALGADVSFSTTITNYLALKAPLASPTFTGTITTESVSINGNTISSTSGALNLTPAVGSAIVLDGTVNVDAGVITGATSISSTAFVGALTGDVSGNAATATKIASITNNNIVQLDVSQTLTNKSLTSPVFTGTPIAPTAASATNSTQLATTAFVHSKIDELVGGAPGALDTLNELAGALGADVSFSTTITNYLALKAPLASPTFTGTITTESVSMGGHLLPTVNDTYDIGSAEFKIRDMYVSDNSLWVGDNHKISIEGGKMKFRKRKDNAVPASILAAGGSSVGALIHSGKGSLENMTLNDWGTYGNTLGLNVQQIYANTSADYEDDIVTASVFDGNATTSTNLSGTAHTAKYVYAAPNANAGAGSFRALVASDIPTLNQDTSGNAGTATTLTGLNVTVAELNTTIADSAGLTGAAFTGDVSVAGNLTVSGTTTVINLDISDNLIGLNNGLTTGAESINDAGIIIARGNTGANAFMGWDESEDKFTVGLTTATAASTGNLTITPGTLVANLEGDVSGNVTGNASGSSGSCTGNADTATKIASITNTDIVLLTATQELTNKTLVAPALGTPVSGDLSNCTFPILNQNTTGTALTVTQAAQTAITSVGTLTGLTMAAEGNIVVDDISGTKIGTSTDQKLGFFNATPIAQPAAADQAVVTSQSLDNTAAATYTQGDITKIQTELNDVTALANQMRTVLVNLGLMKGSA